MKKRCENLKLNSIDDIFKSEEQRQEDNLEKIILVDAEMVYPYARQPFSIERATPDLARLMDSIEQVGIQEPIITRPREGGGYEIISGHRRDYCAKVIGIPDRPIIVRNYTDEEADILVADYNITREDLLPSEKAKAYKLKLDAMKRQGERTDLTSLQIEEKLKGKYSVQILAEQVQENVSMIQRYVRLNNLVPELLEAVDAGKLKFVAAADYISHLTKIEQQAVAEIMESDFVSPSVEQAKRLKGLSDVGKLPEAVIRDILTEEKDFEIKVVIKNDKLKRYFPKEYTPQQMEDVIIKLLEQWVKKRERNSEYDR